MQSNLGLMQSRTKLTSYLNWVAPRSGSWKFNPIVTCKSISTCKKKNKMNDLGLNVAWTIHCQLNIIALIYINFGDYLIWLVTNPYPPKFSCQGPSHKFELFSRKYVRVLLKLFQSELRSPG